MAGKAASLLLWHLPYTCRFCQMCQHGIIKGKMRFATSIAIFGSFNRGVSISYFGQESAVLQPMCAHASSHVASLHAKDSQCKGHQACSLGLCQSIPTTLLDALYASGLLLCHRQLQKAVAGKNEHRDCEPCLSPLGWLSSG